MNAFLVIVLLGLIAIGYVLIIQRSRRGGAAAAVAPRVPVNDSQHQAVIQSVQRLVDLVNDSLRIANESKDVNTKVSRLDFAKTKLEELKLLAARSPFISLTQLPDVEHSIELLEFEFQQAQYRELAHGNMNGQALEKDGKVDEAIAVYEALVEMETDTPFTYRRLAIIYSKRRQHDDELRVLRAAMRNIPEENGGHYKWFADRLANKSGN